MSTIDIQRAINAAKNLDVESDTFFSKSKKHAILVHKIMERKALRQHNLQGYGLQVTTLEKIKSGYKFKIWTNV